MKRSTRQFFLFTLFSSLLVTQAFAQVGNIRGTVTDAEGNPIEGVQIRIEGMEVAKRYKVETDANGAFFHGGVTRQGTYRVIAEKEGYQSAYVEGVQSTTDRKSEQGLVDFTLQRGQGGQLAFELTDEEIEQMQAAAEGRGKTPTVRCRNQAEYGSGIAVFQSGGI